MFSVQIQFGRMPGRIEAFAVVEAHGPLVVSLYVQFHPVHPPAPGLGYHGIHQRFADVLSPIFRKDHQVFDVQVRPFPGGKPFEIDRAAHDLSVSGLGYQSFEDRMFRFEAFFPQVVGIPDDHLRGVVLFGQVLDQAEAPKPYQRRASSPTSPLDSGIDEVLSASAAPRGVAASSRMAASGRSVTGSRDTEPAYLRRGITINTNPPKEGRTHVWTLDAD